MAQQVISEDEVYTPEDVARIFRVSQSTISRALRDGDLQGFKVGRQWRMWGREVIRFIEANQSESLPF